MSDHKKHPPGVKKLMALFHDTDSRLSQTEITRQLGLDSTTVKRYVRQAKARRLLRIADWRAPVWRGDWTPLLGLVTSSEHEDVLKPISAHSMVCDDDSLGYPSQVVTVGINPDHVDMIRDQRRALGPWAGLVRT